MSRRLPRLPPPAAACFNNPRLAIPKDRTRASNSLNCFLIAPPETGRDSCAPRVFYALPSLLMFPSPASAGARSFLISERDLACLPHREGGSRFEGARRPQLDENEDIAGTRMSIATLSRAEMSTDRSRQPITAVQLD